MSEKRDEYTLQPIFSETEAWHNFHHIQRTALFKQDVTEYDPYYHDSFLIRPAKRTQFLLKFNDTAVGTITLDDFGDGSAATRGVAICTEHQEKGHGKALGRLIQDFARSQRINTLCVNAGLTALDYYKKLGFEQEDWDLSELDGVVSPRSVQMVCRNF